MTDIMSGDLESTEIKMEDELTKVKDFRKIETIRNICNNKTKNNIIFKTPLNLTNVYKKYSEFYMLDLYIEIRNIEEYSVYSRTQLNDIIKKAKYFYKFLDRDTSIGYITNTFRKNHKNRPGGLNSIINNLNRRANDISNS